MSILFHYKVDENYFVLSSEPFLNIDTNNYMNVLNKSADHILCMNCEDGRIATYYIENGHLERGCHFQDIEQLTYFYEKGLWKVSLNNDDTRWCDFSVLTEDFIINYKGEKYEFH